MNSLCDTIDTLAMVYLDDELDSVERRELELHLHDCSSCREHIAAERTSRVALRAMLAPPPAPTLLRARIERALAAEDRAVTAAARKGSLTRWALPGAALLAAAAALVIFVAMPRQAEPDGGGRVARDAMRVQSRTRPLEVQGASTGPWLAQHFEPDVNVPSFDDSDVRVVGARLVQVDSRETAQIFYEVVAGPTRLELSAFVFKNAKRGDIVGKQRVVVDGNVLWVMELDSPAGRTSVVSYEDADHNGYVFMSQSFGVQALLDIVVDSDLIRRSHDRVK
jgi:anti-sigma factor RsiW